MSPQRRHHFVRACAVETHVKIWQEPVYAKIYKKNATPQNVDTHFVRACAVETHVKIWQEPAYAEIYRKNAAPQSEHPDQAPAFTSFTAIVRTPLCVDTQRLGKMLDRSTQLWSPGAPSRGREA